MQCLNTVTTFDLPKVKHEWNKLNEEVFYCYFHYYCYFFAPKNVVSIYSNVKFDETLKCVIKACLIYSVLPNKATKAEE